MFFYMFKNVESLKIFTANYWRCPRLQLPHLHPSDVDAAVTLPIAVAAQVHVRQRPTVSPLHRALADGDLGTRGTNGPMDLCIFGHPFSIYSF